MTVRTLAEIKALFETGDRPIGADFTDLVDTLTDLLLQSSGSEPVGKFLISDGNGVAEFEELARYPLIQDFFVGTDLDPITGRYGDVGILWANGAAIDHAKILNNKMVLDPADFGAKETAYMTFPFDVTQRDLILIIPFILGSDGVSSELDLFIRSNSISSKPVRIKLTVSGATGSGNAQAWIDGSTFNEQNFTFIYNASARNILIVVLKGSSLRVYVDNVLKADLIDGASTQTIGNLSFTHGSPSTGTHPIYVDYLLIERI